jgi:hypothetical protein
MGYYIDGSSNYYEGDRRSASDTEVTQRPYPTCTWNAGLSTWEYDLAATRLAVKNQYNTDLNNDLMAAFAVTSDPASILVGLMYLAARADSVAYTDNVANDTPYYDGYQAESGLATTADVHAAVKNDFDLTCYIFGQVMALRDADYAAIDAAVTGSDITAIVYVRPF